MGATYHRDHHDSSPVTLLQRYLWLFAVVGALVASVDAAIGGLSASQIGLALGLGFGASFLIGLSWTVGQLCLVKANRTLSMTVWMLAGLALGLLLADELNAFVRMQGPHRTLALITLAGTSVGGLGLGFISALIQPGHEDTSGIWAKLHSGARWLLVVPLFAISVALIVMERSVMVGLYPAAHTAMWVLGIWGITSATTIALKALQFPIWLTRPGWLIGFALILNAFMYLHTNADETIHKIRQAPTVAFSMNTLRSVTDFDRDDFSSLLGGGDCNAFNSAVNPAAREVPGNGLDDNCMLGDSPIVDETKDVVTNSDDIVGTSVVLITVDTVRPDHLELYGYKRPTTPHLNRFAAQAMVFDRAYSASAWTSLAISAMMRGLYPRRLEWTKVYETNKFHLVREEEKDQLEPGEKLRLLFTMPLDDPRKPLARQLQERGMYTAAVVDDGYAEFLSAKMGVADGFDRFETADNLPKKSRNDKGTVNLAMKVLREAPKNQEFFLWVHLFGPHDPNSRHRGVKRFGKKLVDKYDHELVYADQQLGRLLRRLNWMARSRRLAIAITSDHGEQFFKRRRYHGVNLRESNVRVPLLISHPDWPAGRTDTLASLVDVAPSILAWTGTTPSHRQDGKDLSQYVLGYEPSENRHHIAETWYVSQTGTVKRDLVAVFDGKHKVVHNRLRNLTKVVKQTSKKRKLKNLGRKFKPAKPLLTELKRYLEETSGPIWKN